MPRIKTEEFLARIEAETYEAVILRGLQNGSFYLILQSADGSFIHENADGSVKEYPKADHALVWLQRMTAVKTIAVDIEHWNEDKK